MRIKKTRAGADTFYINRYFEVSGSGVKTKYYYLGDQRVAMRSQSVLTMLHADHLGSTVAATQGSTTSVLTYRAYGSERPGGDPLPTDHRFTGQKQDDTGLLYYRARYYDKLLGAFISPDPVIPDAENVFAYNRYLYALANPLKYNDPTGHYAYEGSPDDSYFWRRDKPSTAIVRTTEPVVFWEETQQPDLFLPLKTIYGGTLALATVGILLADVAPAAPAVTAALCADGDCTNDIDISARIGQSVWRLPNFIRGRVIEDHLGRSPMLARNYPVIDRFENGVATSIKSINLNDGRYQNTGRLRSTLTGYVNQMAQYQGRSNPWGGISVSRMDITARALDLAIPPGATPQQMEVLFEMQRYAAEIGVTLNIIPVR